MVAFLIPPSPPYSVPAGTVWPGEPGFYTFNQMGGGSYLVAEADVRPTGALSNAYLRAYAIAMGGGHRGGGVAPV